MDQNFKGFTVPANVTIDPAVLAGQINPLLSYTELQDKPNLTAPRKDAITSNNSTFDGPHSWVQGIGTAVNSVANGLWTITFTSSNQSFKLAGVLTSGQLYNFKIRCRRVSGTFTKFQIGSIFSSTSIGVNNSEITPTATMADYSGTFTANGVDLWIGVLTAHNTGGVLEIDTIEIFVPEQQLDLGVGTTSGAAISADFTERNKAFLGNYVQRKKLTVIGFLGSSMVYRDDADSGTFEGTYQRPPQMGTNSYVRQLWEKLKTDGRWNVPTYQQAHSSNPAWAVSGTWTRNNNRGSLLRGSNTTLGVVSYTSELDAYAEMTLPASHDNFSFVTSASASGSTLAILVSNSNIDGGNWKTPAQLKALGTTLTDEYGNELADTFSNSFSSANIPAKYFASGATSDTNTVAVVLYKYNPVCGLPTTGTTKIRIQNKTSGSFLDLWGGFSWTGYAVHVHRSGWPSRDVNQIHWQLYANTYMSKVSHLLIENCSLNGHAHASPDPKSEYVLKGTATTGGYWEADQKFFVNRLLKSCRELYITPVMMAFPGLGISALSGAVTNYASDYPTNGTTRTGNYRTFATGTASACMEQGAGFMDVDQAIIEQAAQYGNPAAYYLVYDTAQGYNHSYAVAGGIIDERNISNGAYLRKYIQSDGQHFAQGGQNEVFKVMNQQLVTTWPV